MPPTTTTGYVTVSIGASYVQNWLNDPTQNHGIIVSNRTSGDRLVILSRFYPTPTARPTLILKTVGP